MLRMFSRFQARNLCLCFLLLVLLSLNGACVRRVPQQPPTREDPVLLLKDELERIFSNEQFSNAFWGVVVESAESGDILYRRLPEKLMMPASNMKILTAAASLQFLGRDFTYETLVQTDGSVQDGKLTGNLIITGSGDPTISGHFYGGDTLRVFREWASRLKDLGINEISGDIIGVDDAFDDVRWGAGWSWDDLGYPGAAEVSALEFNDDLFTVTLSPGQINSLDPDTSYVQVVNSVTLASEGEKKAVVWKREGNIIFAEGKIPPGEDDYGTFAVNNPAAYFVHVLKEVLEKNGIVVKGETYRVRDRHIVLPSNLTVLFSRQSPSLLEIVSVMLKESNNLYAEILLKTLGKAVKNDGTADSGKKVIEDFLASAGISSNSYILADGSGLSRYNYLTPALLAQVLRSIYQSNFFSDFYNALPAAGSEGTIKERLKGGLAEANVHAKTGTLANVRCLSGYVRSRDGEMMIFAMIANNFNVPRQSAEHLQDLALERLANFSRQPQRHQETNTH